MNILLGITGSIAAYKTPLLIRQLREQGHTVKVVLTTAGKAFVTPLTLQALSGHPVYENLLDPDTEASMGHITLARWAHGVLIAPASANIMAKLAQGVADDLLTTLCLATQAPVIMAPAMNQAMWAPPATQANAQTLRARGVQFIGPEAGLQACGETGLGRMTDPAHLITCLNTFISPPFLRGERVLITGGPTQEPIDPVRFLSNRSSGKMAYALAHAARCAGAQVTLVSGPTTLTPPSQCRFIPVKTASDMLAAVEKEIATHTLFISAAAVADYCSVQVATEKIKKTGDTLTLTLTPTPDILARVCSRPVRPFCVGFAAETQSILLHAKEKKLKKGADLMVVNDVSRTDIGFEQADNAVAVITEKQIIHLEKASKTLIAQQLLKIIAAEMQAQQVVT